MPKCPPVPSAAAGGAARQAFPQSALLWAGDFCKLWHAGNFNQDQGLVGGAVYKSEWKRRSRLCLKKRGREKKKERKKNTQTQKSKPEKNKKAVLQRGSIQAVPILVLSWLMENHQRLPHLNGTLSTGNVNAVTNARVCQAYQPGCETGDAPRPARTAVMDNDISRLMDGR